VSGVALNYGPEKREILNNVNIAIEPNELVALVGPSGSGKTSLLHLIAGLKRARAGRISIFGMQPGAAVRDGTVALGFQDPALFPWLKARANAKWLVKMRGIDRDEECIDQLWDLLELTREISDHYPGGLSGGESQRVSLARSLAMASKLYLLDEPLSAVDYLRRRRIVFGLRNRFKQAGAACLYVTHDIPDAVHFADRIVFSGGEGATFDQSIWINLSADRPPEIREDKAFAHLVSQVSKLLEKAELCSQSRQTKLHLH